MKSRLIITFIASVVSLSAMAEICPTADSFDPMTPPAGWSLVPPPIVHGQKFQFIQAIHSFNPGFYYLQIMCVYMACQRADCPAFEIISNTTYDLPTKNASPWNAPSAISHTLACAPEDDNPQVCEFSNAKPLNPR